MKIFNIFFVFIVITITHNVYSQDNYEISIDLNSSYGCQYDGTISGVQLIKESNNWVRAGIGEATNGDLKLFLLKCTSTVSYFMYDASVGIYEYDNGSWKIIEVFSAPSNNDCSTTIHEHIMTSGLPAPGETKRYLVLHHIDAGEVACDGSPNTTSAINLYLGDFLVYAKLPADLDLSNSTVPSTVSYNGGSYTVRVNNIGEKTLTWDYSSCPSWVTIETPSDVDEGNYQLTDIQIAENTSTSSRSASIKFYNSENSGDYEYLYIYQEGAPEPADLDLSNSTVPNIVPYSGGNYTVRVNNLGDNILTWNYSNCPSWVTIETPNSVSGGNYQLTDIQIAENTSTSSRSANIKFYNTTNSSDYEYLTFTQEGAPEQNSITLTAPNGGENYVANDNMHITWTSTGSFSEVTIGLSIDGGSTIYQEIVGSTANDGAYDWTVPSGINSNTCKIVIGSLNQTPNVTDISDANFTIGYGSCYYTDCPDGTNCGAMGDQGYEAITGLCNLGILDDDGTIEPDNLIIREDLAKIMFYALFGSGTQTTPADNYPSFFADLEQTTAIEDYHRYAKVMSYLDYGDGFAAFDRYFYNFNPGKTIERIYVVKALLEAFNIEPASYTSPNPFPNDPDIQVGGDKYGYLVKAVDLGIVDNSNDLFRPYDACTRAEAFVMLWRIIDGGNVTIPSSAELQDEANYFLPGNYNQNNLAFSPDMSKGVFKHYTKTSFAIDGLMPLVFEHTYASYLTEWHEELIPYEPLTKGWTHTYNCYLIRTKNIQGIHMQDNEDKIIVMWGDATLSIFDDDGANYEPAQGVYSDLYTDGDNFKLKTKGQVIYTFARQTADENAPYMLISIEDRNGNKTILSYETVVDNIARLSTVTDPSGRQLKFTYEDNSNYLVSVSEVGIIGRSITFAYNYKTVNEKGKNYQQKLLQFYNDPEGNHTEYRYGLPFGETDPNYKGNNKNMLTTIIDPKNIIDTVGYQDRKATYISTTNQAGETFVSEITHNPITHNSTIHQYVDADGTISMEKNFNFSNTIDEYTNTVTGTGVDKEVIEWDAQHPELPKIVRVYNLKYFYTYDENANILSVKVSNLDGSEYVEETFTYTDLNDIETYTNAENKITHFGYTDGNLTSVTDAEGFTTTIGRNPNGTIDYIENPEGITVNFNDYDNYGNPHRITTALTEINADFDNASRLTDVWITENGIEKRTSYEYNNNDAIIKSIVSGTGTEDVITLFERDANDNIDYITNAEGGITDFTYESQTDFLSSVSFGGSTRSYTYYGNGALKTVTKPDGTVLTYYYDDIGRLESCKINNTEYYRFFYDEYNRIEKVENKVGSEIKTIYYYYDALNRIDHITDWFGNNVYYTYYKTGQVKTIKYPDDKTVTYTYYDNGWLYTVADWNGNLTQYQYFNDGRLKFEILPNYVVTGYQYDEDGRLTHTITRKIYNGTSYPIITEYSYTWDAFGNITEEQKTQPAMAYPNIDINDETTYTYEKYDGVTNNRIDYFSKNGATTNIDIDENGNTVLKGNTQYLFDYFDRLIGVTSDNFTAVYKYDASGIRREAIRTINGDEKTTRYVIGIGNNILIETDEDNNAEYYYIYGKGLLYRIKADDNSTRFYHGDLRGSVVAITDENATVTHKYSYDEFGNIVESEEEDFNPFRYVGKYGVMYEKEDLYFMRARYYDPEIGRFLSEDPIWATNLYPYAGNNPITGIDPSGLSAYFGAGFNNIDINELGINNFDYHQNENFSLNIDEAIDGIIERLSVLNTIVDIGTVVSPKNFSEVSKYAEPLTPIVSTLELGNSIRKGNPNEILKTYGTKVIPQLTFWGLAVAFEVPILNLVPAFVEVMYLFSKHIVTPFSLEPPLSTDGGKWIEQEVYLLRLQGAF